MSYKDRVGHSARTKLEFIKTRRLVYMLTGETGYKRLVEQGGKHK